MQGLSQNVGEAVCTRETFNTEEQRPQVREVIRHVREHRPFEKEFVNEVGVSLFFNHYIKVVYLYELFFHMLFVFLLSFSGLLCTQPNWLCFLLSFFFVSSSSASSAGLCTASFASTAPSKVCLHLFLHPFPCPSFFAGCISPPLLMVFLLFCTFIYCFIWLCMTHLRQLLSCSSFCAIS